MHSFQPETTMRALARQTSELDALDAHIANSVASAADDVGEDGVVTASVTPAKGVRTLTVKTARDDADGEGDAARKRAKNAFSIALEEEIEHMHDRECATPATTASAVPLHAAVARGDAAALPPRVTPRREMSSSRHIALTAIGGALAVRVDASRSRLDRARRVSFRSRD